MTPDEKRVYDLVARRFIAVFYPDCEIANTTVMAQVGVNEFKATGKQIIDPAWRVVFPAASNKQSVRTCCPCMKSGRRDRTRPNCRRRKRATEVLHGGGFVAGDGDCRKTGGRRGTQGSDEGEWDRTSVYPGGDYRDVIEKRVYSEG